MLMKDNHHQAKFPDEVFISTQLVDKSLRSEFWREASRPFYETSPIVGSESDDLEGAIRSREIAGLTFASVAFNAQRYKRDRRIIAYSELDHYLVAIVTAGTISGDGSGTNFSAKTGDICVLDLAQVLQSEVTSGGTISVLIPRPALAKATSFANLHGRVLAAELPMTKLLTTYLEGMKSLETNLSDDNRAAVQEALITLLAAAVQGGNPADDGEVRYLSLALRQRVLDFIDQNINNPALSLDLILRRFNVSRAHVYRAFAEDGGIASLIRDRRLDAAFLELKQKNLAFPSIAKIAFGHGFSNATHFTRCFRARFGLTPNEARHEWLTGQKTSELKAHLSRFGRRETSENTQETTGL
jgi:AraC-like DNA-binding protein